MQNRETFKYRQPTGPSKILAILRKFSSILTSHARGLPSGGLGLESHSVIYKTGLKYFAK